MTPEDPLVSPLVSGLVSGLVGNEPPRREPERKPAGHSASSTAKPLADQSRLRKGVNPLPFRPRPVADEQRLALARRLTDRDRQVLRAVARHRVLTGDHLGEMFFTGRRRAQERLRDLHRLELLDRFEPFRPAFGRVPLHYVIGRLGAAVLDAEDGCDPDRAIRRWKADRALVLGGSQKLVHLLAVNSFYAALVGHARREPSGVLVDWMTEQECSRWSDEIVRPDAYGVWHEMGTSLEFLLEYDRGTETLARLVAKLGGYERLEIERGATAWVLFAFTTPRREATARAALAAAATVPVATAALTAPVRPHDAVWRPLAGRPAHPHRLAELAAVPKPPEALQRAASDPAGAWRFERSRPEDEEAPIETP